MPLLEEKRSYCQEDRTAINVKKKLPVKGGSYAKVVITLEDPIINSFPQVVLELDTTTTDKTSDETGTKSGRTVTLTTEDMQKKKNDVKARITLLLSLPDEHQLRFSKYKTTRELWAAILKTFGGNEATKKPKKNLLKQQYGNFRAEGSETLESNLDTISLDDMYNHLKVNESKVQKKSEPNSQNMAFISLVKHSSGNEDGNTACVPTASTNVPTASASDINQIDKDDMEEIDIKWNMALLSMRADKFWKRTRKKISIQGSDVAGFDKSKIECFNYHKMGHFARECMAPRSQDRGRRDNFRQRSKAKEQALKSLMTGLPKCTDDTVTDYSRPSPTLESTSEEDQNRNPSVSKNVASPITPKPFIKFVNPKDSQSESKTDKKETPKKPPVKYAEQFRKSNKKPNVRGNQRNRNNLKSHQLGLDFVMKKKACFNCGNFNHLAYDCRKRVKKNFTPRAVADRPYRPSQRPVRTNMNDVYGSPTVNRYFLPVNKKISTGSRNFSTANRKFPTASRKFPTGSIKSPTADMGMKGKVVKPSACWSWKPS
nr:hypothetical protein [Tanacetum cinerariifolium]